MRRSDGRGAQALMGSESWDCSARSASVRPIAKTFRCDSIPRFIFLFLGLVGESALEALRDREIEADGPAGEALGLGQGSCHSRVKLGGSPTSADAQRQANQFFA